MPKNRVGGPVSSAHDNIEKTDALRRAVAEADDLATELALNRVCVGRRKPNYMLRCQGTESLKMSSHVLTQACVQEWRNRSGALSLTLRGDKPR